MRQTDFRSFSGKAIPKGLALVTQGLALNGLLKAVVTPGGSIGYQRRPRLHVREALPT